MLDKKMDYFYRFLIESSVEEKIGNKFLKELILYLESEMQGYLEMREAYWIEEKDRKKYFEDPVNELDSVK